MPRRASSLGGLARSFGYAWVGLVYAARTQRNLRIHLFLAGLALAAAIFVHLPRGFFAVLILAITLVLVAELFNTALEAAVDLQGTVLHPLAKVAKDVSAGAVLVMAAGALGTGLLLFGPRLERLGPLLIDLGRTLPGAVVAAALALAVRPLWRSRGAPAWGAAAVLAIGTRLFLTTGWAGPALFLTLAGLVPASLGPGRPGGRSLLGGLAAGVLVGLVAAHVRV